MIYDTSKDFDKQSALAYFNKLILGKKIIEIKEIKPLRTLNQNRYIHLLFNWFAYQTGYTSDEVKQMVFKQIVNADLFYEGEFETSLGTKIHRFRSTKDLDTKEMTTAIDKFRDYASSEAGIYLPEPSDLASIQLLELELKRSNTI